MTIDYFPLRTLGWRTWLFHRWNDGRFRRHVRIGGLTFAWWSF